MTRDADESLSPADDAFVLDTKRGARVVFHSRCYDVTGRLDSYVVDLEAERFHASTPVANPGAGSPPSRFFDDLATHWSGWAGLKTWGALDGELRIQAGIDLHGHVTLAFLVPEPSSADGWSATARVELEAGRLERTAAQARAFFDEAPAADDDAAG